MEKNNKKEIRSAPGLDANAGFPSFCKTCGAKRKNKETKYYAI